MSKSSQEEGAAGSAGQEASSGGTPKKTPGGDIYENPGGSKKIIRIVTVLAYMFSVSFVGIMLSAYYVFLWHPPNPRLQHKAQHLKADPQFEFLVDTRPASLFPEANRTSESADKPIRPDEDLRIRQQAVQKAMTFAQVQLKADSKNLSFNPSSLIGKKYVNLNASQNRSHRLKQNSETPRRNGGVENSTDFKYGSRVSLRNILQGSTVTSQYINRTNDKFNAAALVLEKNASAFPVTFVNDGIRSINETELNSTESKEFIDRALSNSSSVNLTFDHPKETEENFNETELTFPQNLQANTINPTQREGNEIIGSPDVSPAESKIITEVIISSKLIEESTNDSYTENRNVSTYPTDTLIDTNKITESSGMDGLMISLTESTHSVLPLQNDLKTFPRPDDMDSMETTSETTSTFETARTEFEDNMEDLQTIDKNR